VNEHGLSPLHVAAKLRNFELVMVLLGTSADTELRDLSGKTALTFAYIRYHQVS
jgi:ankyrin repeat protein